MKKKLLVATLLLAGVCAPAQENFTILEKWLKYSDIENSLYHHLADIAYDSLAARKARISQLQTPADWQDQQRRVKQLLYQIVGPFPQKTPLNPRVVGVLQRPRFRVEKIIYESQPRFYVTAHLYLPKNLKNRAPAVIYCSGHTADGFRSKTYQTVILNLVHKGFIVLAFDPVGQGERLQYFDPATGESAVGGPTKEHSYPGAQCFISGSSLARYFIWDGIRAVDYLLTRPEVDPHRIGVTGRSGGGTQSSYIAAFDDRIYAAAPECYITNFTRLLQSIGPQDAEQNFPRGILSGIDHADLIEARAPKPTLLIGTTRDFFSIQGLLETYKEAKSAFDLLGHPENLQLSIDDTTHASTQKNREALYAFFQKHLAAPGNASEIDVQYFSQEELSVTPSGQVSTSFDGETVFSLNKKRALKELAQLARARRQADHVNMVRSKIKELQIAATGHAAVFTGRIRHSDYEVEKYFIEKNNYAIPFLIIKPTDAGESGAVLYLSPKGKDIVNERRPFIKKLLGAGKSVIVPDVIGVGECGPGDFRGDAYKFKMGIGAYNVWFLGLQVGQPVVRLQATDLLDVLAYVHSRQDNANAPVAAIAEGGMAPVLQFAAAANESIAPVILINSLYSYQAIVANEFYMPEHIHAVDPFALPYFDLIDLNASVAPRDLCIINPIDELGNTLASDKTEEIFAFLRSTYSQHPAAQLKIVSGSSRESTEAVILSFLHASD